MSPAMESAIADDIAGRILNPTLALLSVFDYIASEIYELCFTF